MATTTRIHVTACDNELYILASTPAGSSEICHLKSGYNNKVEYAVIPQSVLQHGDYTLTMIGINWGGPQAFKVTLTTGGVDTVHSAPAGTGIGDVWHESVSITV
jgi:hypothetical protein